MPTGSQQVHEATLICSTGSSCQFSIPCSKLVDVLPPNDESRQNPADLALQTRINSTLWNAAVQQLQQQLDACGKQFLGSKQQVCSATQQVPVQHKTDDPG